MKQLIRGISVFGLFLFSLAALSAPLNAPPVQDWSQEAHAATAQGLPIMVVFDSADCRYCEAMNNQLLNPLLAKGQLQKQVHLRSFDIDRQGKVTDFDGEAIRARLFVKRYAIYATPTVVLLDNKGHMLSEPIVGYNGTEAYTQLLQHAIHQASEKPVLTAHRP